MPAPKKKKLTNHDPTPVKAPTRDPASKPQVAIETTAAGVLGYAAAAGLASIGVPIPPEVLVTVFVVLGNVLMSFLRDKGIAPKLTAVLVVPLVLGCASGGKQITPEECRAWIDVLQTQVVECARWGDEEDVLTCQRTASSILAATQVSCARLEEESAPPADASAHPVDRLGADTALVAGHVRGAAPKAGVAVGRAGPEEQG